MSSHELDKGMNMASRMTRWILSAPAAAALLGCVSGTPHYDREFGNAVRANLVSQVLDPAASANTNPAAGIDGQAARAAHEQYQRSYSRPQAEPARPLIGTGK